MLNFHITFTYPWLFLLLIPAVALTLIPYFLISKKYRRTRNRITSIVLHLIVMFLCVSVLVGVNFSYEVYNSENELLLVVDASYSTQEEKDAKDEYVLNVLSIANPNSVKIGVVTFGYDQQYAVPFTSDFTGAYDRYLESAQPDTSATDIEAALTFASELFSNPESGKIILVSDGIETDSSAMSVVKSIASRGIGISTVCCGTLVSDQEVQLIGAELPDYNVALNEDFDITLSLQSNYSDVTEVSVALYDNGVIGETVQVNAGNGVSTVVFRHALTETGLHTLNFVVTTENDLVAENNTFCSYIYLVNHESVLIIQPFEGQSDDLVDLLDDNYKPVVKTIGEADFPTTLAQLREYDEIILNNIANADLPEGFSAMLYEYVYVVGGGLFTVGGSEPNDVETAHAYNRADLLGTQLQQMLPVQAINYTPPLGLAVVIDISGSMTGDRIEAAKAAAITLVKDSECLSERDYCAILTLSTNFTEETDFIPMTRYDELIEAINNIGIGGATSFAPALKRASMDLLALYASDKIQKMHVVVITDGGASDYSDYYAVVEEYYAKGVTFSFAAIEATSSYMEQLEAAAEAGGGRAFNAQSDYLTTYLKNDLIVPEIKEVEYRQFTPRINTGSSYSNIVSQENMPSLYGFYGTKIKSGAEIVLEGEYGVPVYAQWRYGAGMVGSFMCDLSGNWSAEFMADDAGKTFLLAVVNKLFPAGDIRSKDLNVVLREENYATQVSIYAVSELTEDESVNIQVENISGGTEEITVIQPTEGDSYSRASFVVREAGVYEIVVQRLNGEELVNSYTIYKTFSYSSEYDMFNTTDRVLLMENLAASGNGVACSLEDGDPYEAFEGFVVTLQRNFDPRFVFIIVALILFLLDIAVRKFKFKWPHEIIRDFKERKKR